MALSSTRVQISVGGFVVCAFVLVTVWATAGGVGLFKPKFEVTCFLPANLGFSSSTPVAYRGMRIGRVRDVGFAEEEGPPGHPIRLVLAVDDTHRDRLFDRFVVTYEADPFGGVLSNKVILQAPQDEDGSPLPIGNPITDGQVLSFFQEKPIQQKLEELAESVAEQTLPVIDEVAISLEDLLSGVAGLIDELTDPTGDVQTTIRGIRRAIENLNDPGGPILGTMASIGRITKSVESSEGPVGKLLHDPEMAQRLSEASEEIQTLLKSVNTITDELARSTPALLKETTSLLTRLDSLAKSSEPLPGQIGEILTSTDKALAPFAEQARRVEQLLVLAKRDAELAQDILAALKRHWLLSSFVEDEPLDNPSAVRPLLDPGGNDR